MKQLRIEIRFRNNLIIERRERMGMNQHELAIFAELSPYTVCGYETLRLSPVDRDGADWMASAKKMSTALGVEPEELWPEEVLAVQTVRAERLMDVRELASRLLPGHEPDGLLDAKRLKERVAETIATCSSPRHQEVVLRRFGLGGYDEHTLVEVGEKIGVSTERVRQMESKVFRQLRHPSRVKRLQAFVE